MSKKGNYQLKQYGREEGKMTRKETRRNGEDEEKNDNHYLNLINTLIIIELIFLYLNKYISV